MTPNTHFNQVLSKFELRSSKPEFTGILLFDGRWTCASVEIGKSKARAQNKNQSESIWIDVYLDLIKKRSPAGQHIRTCVVWNKFQIRFNVNIYWNGIASQKYFNKINTPRLYLPFIEAFPLLHTTIGWLNEWTNKYTQYRVVLHTTLTH